MLSTDTLGAALSKMRSCHVSAVAVLDSRSKVLPLLWGNGVGATAGTATVFSFCMGGEVEVIRLSLSQHVHPFMFRGACQIWWLVEQQALSLLAPSGFSSGAVGVDGLSGCSRFPG